MKDHKFKETGSSAMPPNKKGYVYPKGYSRNFTRKDGTFKIRKKSGMGNGPKSGKKQKGSY